MKIRDDCFKYLENNESISIGDGLAFDTGNLNSLCVVYTVVIQQVMIHFLLTT